MNTTKLIKSGKDFNIELDGNFYYRVDTMFMRLKQGELLPEQLTKKGWVKC